MNRFLYAFLLAPLSLLAADVKISDLPLKASVSTNTFLEVADMNAVTKSGKYLLTNLATVASVSGLGITNYHVAPGANITVATNVVGTNVTWTVTGTSQVTFNAVTNALSMDGDTNKFVNGKGLLTPIYSTVTNFTMLGTNGITVTGTTNGTNITITVGTTNTSGAWGNITGNIISQTDLSTALTNKVLKAGDTMTGTLVTPELDTSQLLVGAMAVSRGTLTHAGGNVIVDFALTNRYWSCTLTGNVTFVLTNAAAGKWANLLLFQSQATNVTPTFNLPAGTTNWFGGAPSTLTAGTVGALSYYCIDSTTNSTKAAYAETQ